MSQIFDTHLIVTSKLEEVRRDEKGNLTEDTDFFLNFYPNFYKLPVTKETYELAMVGKSYTITLR